MIIWEETICEFHLLQIYIKKVDLFQFLEKGFLGFSLCDCDDDHFVGIQGVKIYLVMWGVTFCCKSTLKK